MSLCCSVDRIVCINNPNLSYTTNIQLIVYPYNQYKATKGAKNLEQRTTIDRREKKQAQKAKIKSETQKIHQNQCRIEGNA